MDSDKGWFPVARVEEVVPRHVVHAQLLGQEIALWRDDAGQLNAWENRCPHRGVRLSIGINDGKELRCRYHGWHYASGSGQCTFIPAHPDQKPPNVIKTKPYGVTELYGFVWVNLGGDADVAAVPALGLNAFTTLRSIYVAAPAAAVAEHLAGRGFEANGGFILEDESRTTLLLQPMDGGQTVIHGLATGEVAGDERLALLRRHNETLTEVRDAVERAAA
jgi:nitrite reductase/ring-hydroxylating ferredoxin subunit